ncbi:RNA pseudouridine synthase [Roseomonas sp. CAU 1739]|uniref:RluA family pseudouridine synthase n=1 Tax=Roseomonas sp. CAU 1739 TaxID=3140364 RepID=UPI00325AB95B
MMRGRLPRPAAPRQAPPPAIAARILLLRDDVLVLDKPAGLAVHRGPRGGASIEDWLPALQMGKRHLPQPAHRLDTDTAGCLVLGRTKPALAALGRIFAAGQADKTYWAVLRGVPDADEGMIDAPLRKVSSAARGWRMEVHPGGQPAVTRWRVLGRAAGMAWVELRPETGRTHQLRVHCAAQGWPILGDPFYGQAAPGGLHLLARAIALPLDPPVAAVAPVPQAMAAAFGACGWDAARP